MDPCRWAGNINVECWWRERNMLAQQILQCRLHDLFTALLPVPPICLYSCGFFSQSHPVLSSSFLPVFILFPPLLLHSTPCLPVPWKFTAGVLDVTLDTHWGGQKLKKKRTNKKHCLWSVVLINLLLASFLSISVKLTVIEDNSTVSFMRVMLLAQASLKIKSINYCHLLTGS